MRLFWSLVSGAPVEATQPAPEAQGPPAPERHPKCLNCGTLIDIHAEACAKCGAKFLTRCKRCNTPVSPTWHVCPECGAAFH